MKINRKLLACLMVLLLAAGWVSFGMQTGETYAAYHALQAEAGAAEMEGLYEKAAQKYEECLQYQDNLENRMKMTENYAALALESGTYTRIQKVEECLEALRKKYPKEPRIYEFACSFYQQQEDRDGILETLSQAESVGVSTPVLTACQEQLHYQYDLGFSSYLAFLPLTEELYAVQSNEGWNYANRSGELYLTGDYDCASIFYGDLASVTDDTGSWMIDSEGEKQLTLPEGVTQAGAYSEGLVALKRTGGFEYYNPQTKEFFGNYEEAGRFSDGIVAVKEDGLWKIIDTTGTPISDRTFEDVVLSFTGSCYSDGYIIAKSDGVYRFYDRELNPALDFTCEDIDFCVESVFAFERDGLWGFADLSGNVLIEPAYEEAKSFSCGLAGVKKDGLWGFINESGELVVPYTFLEVDYVNDRGGCFVRESDVWKMMSFVGWS